LVVALNSVGSATLKQLNNAEQSRAHHLARGLMAEIIGLDYQDPDGTPGFGPESGEDKPGTRANFDDVDDYHGWKASPPEENDGTPLADFAGWLRGVIVEYVSPDDLTRVAGTDKGVKRVTVIVIRNNTEMACLTMIVTDSWQRPPYE